MKHILFTICGAGLFCLAANGQVSQQWATPYNGAANQSDQGKAIAVDASGNVYVTGRTTNGSGSFDILTIKYNSLGVQQWATPYNGTGNGDDIGRAIAVDGAGNVYITGQALVAGVGMDMVTIKYNALGVQQWAQLYNGPANFDDDGVALKLDASANVYVAGWRNNASFTEDYVTVKYSPAGAQLWMNFYNHTANSNDLATDIGIDASGNVFTTGQSRNSAFDYDYATIKYSSLGTQQWVYRYDSGSGDDIAYALTVDGSSNVIVTGSNALNSGDCMTIKYNSAGIQQWATPYNGPAGNGEVPLDITADASGNIIIAGYTFTATSADYVTIKYNSAGVQQWAMNFNGTSNGDDYALNMALDGSGNIYVVGYSTVGSNYDYATVKYTAAGTEAWRINYNYNNNSDLGLAIAVDASNNVYITGQATFTGANWNYATVKYSQSSPLTATQSQVNVTCNGVCTGSATVVASGGVPPYTYSWMPSGGSAATASSLCAGSYTCTITDNVGTQITPTFNITQPPALTTTGTQTNILCNGSCTGSALVSVSGGTSPYSYSWAPTGGNSASTTSRCAGNYTCTITDASGCTTTRTFLIVQPTAISISITPTNITCNGGNNGSACAAVSGGTPPYTYAWSPSGGNAVCASGLSANCYTLTVTDANGCVANAGVCITQPPALSATGTQTNIICNGACTGSASVTVTGGTLPYTYSWIPSGPTSNVVTARCAGSYTCNVYDANACSTTVTFNITQPPAPVVSGTSTNPTCFGECTGTASVTSVTNLTGPYTYSWNPNVSSGASASNLCAGTYVVTITGASGCTRSHTFNITSPPAIALNMSTPTNVACNGGNNGSVCVNPTGGTPPFTYIWNPSATTTACLANAPAGCYTITVTDANGCTAVASTCITEPAVITPNPMQNNISCNGGGNGHLMVSPSGGTPVYTYSWTPVINTTNVLNGSPAGTYTCYITDQNGCTASQTFLLTEPPPLITAETHTNVTCFSMCDGAVTINAAGGVGGYSYNWSPSAPNSASLSSLCAGPYVCTVTDLNGCNVMQALTITQPSAISLTGGVNNVLCHGGSDGSIMMSTSGGAAPYNWLWSTGDTTEDISGLDTGVYVITVTDAAGCTFTTGLTVNQPPPIVVTLTVTDATCYSNCDGAIYSTVTGGVPGYSYDWNPSGNMQPDFIGICAGTYTLQVTDANGCNSGYYVDTVNSPPPVNVTYSEPMDTVCQTTTGPFALSGESPSGGIWSGPNVTGNIFDPTNATLGNSIITYTYVDSMGCTGFDTDTIYVDLCLNIIGAENPTVTVYPNPSSGIFSVTAEVNSIITIYDALGNVVIEKKSVGTTTEIDLQTQPDGIYLLVVRRDDASATGRLILSK